MMCWHLHAWCTWLASMYMHDAFDFRAWTCMIYLEINTYIRIRTWHVILLNEYTYHSTTWSTYININRSISFVYALKDMWAHARAELCTRMNMLIYFFQMQSIKSFYSMHFHVRTFKYSFFTSYCNILCWLFCMLKLVIIYFFVTVIYKYK